MVFADRREVVRKGVGVSKKMSMEVGSFVDVLECHFVMGVIKGEGFFRLFSFFFLSLEGLVRCIATVRSPAVRLCWASTYPAAQTRVETRADAVSQKSGDLARDVKKLSIAPCQACKASPSLFTGS